MPSSLVFVVLTASTCLAYSPGVALSEASPASSRRLASLEESTASASVLGGRRLGSEAAVPCEALAKKGQCLSQSGRCDWRNYGHGQLKYCATKVDYLPCEALAKKGQCLSQSSRCDWKRDGNGQLHCGTQVAFLPCEAIAKKGQCLSQSSRCDWKNQSGKKYCATQKPGRPSSPGHAAATRAPTLAPHTPAPTFDCSALNGKNAKRCLAAGCAWDSRAKACSAASSATTQAPTPSPTRAIRTPSPTFDCSSYSGKKSSKRCLSAGCAWDGWTRTCRAIPAMVADVEP